MVELDKSAVTRMENTQVKAKQMGMQNDAAKASLRTQHAGTSKPPQAPVGATGRINRPKPDLQKLAPEPTQLPSGPPVLPDEQRQGFDPEVFKQDFMDNLVGQVRTEQFLESPRVKDAMTKVEIKEFFNGRNSNRKPDQRNYADRVISRTGLV